MRAKYLLFLSILACLMVGFWCVSSTFAQGIVAGAQTETTPADDEKALAGAGGSDSSNIVEEFYDEETDDIRWLQDDAFIKENLAEPESLMATTPLRLSLEDAVKIALQHNTKIQASGYDIDAAKARRSEANIGYPIFEYEVRSAPVPRNAKTAVSSFFSGDITWFNELKVGMGIPVFTFGKVALVKQMADDGIEAARIYSWKTKAETVYEVKQLYFGILLAEEIGRLLKKAHEALVDEIKRQSTKKDVSQLDTLKMKVFLYDLDRRLAETRQKGKLALYGLRVQLGLSPGTVFTVFSTKLRPIPTVLRSVDDYLTVAAKKRPDAQLLDIGVATKRNLYMLEKRKVFPDIGVGAFAAIGRTFNDVIGLTNTDDFNNPFNYQRAGVGLQIKGTFDVNGSNAKIKRAESEYFKVNMEQMVAREGLKLDVRRAFMDAQVANENLKLADEAQKAARQMLFLAQSNYDIGIGNQQDFIDSLQAVMLSRSRYFEAVFNYNVALAQLDAKIGVLPEIGDGG